MILCLGYGLLFYFYPTNSAYIVFPLCTLHCSNQLCRFFMLLSALLFFLEKCKNTLPQFSDEVKSSRSVVLIRLLLTMTAATASRGSRSCSRNIFQYWPGQCVRLHRHHLASALLCHIFIRVWESPSRSSVQHGFQKYLSISKHLRKLYPDHRISSFDLAFLAVTCEEGKQSFE